MKHGDTFRFPERVDNHLWIVLSDPLLDSERVLIVNISTWQEYEDQTCILTEHDHPWLKWKSCVMYRLTRPLTGSQWTMICSSSVVEKLEPLAQPVLQRVMDGAAQSKHFDFGHGELLADQGLIDI